MANVEAELARLEKMIAEIRRTRETTEHERLKAAALREQAREIGAESKQSQATARALVAELNELIEQLARK